MENEVLKNDAEKPDSGSAAPKDGDELRRIENDAEERHDPGAVAPGEDSDGCDVAITDSTPDEELPITEGGVA
jgi:hypothetical protein